MLKNIQVLRALAASMVAFHHILMGRSGSLLTTLSEYGFVGVDLFFVISGLVISHSMKDKQRNLETAVGFLKRRFLRIYLGYWPFFVFTLLIRYIINPEDIPKLQIVHSFFLSSTDVFELVLPISWSLSYEIYFYLVYFISLLIPIKYTKHGFLMLTLTLIAVIIGFPIKRDTHLGFLLSPFVVEFLSGLLIGFYLSKCRSKILALICILGFIASYYFGFAIEAKQGLYRLMTFGVSSFLLVFIAVIFENVHLNQAPNFMVTLGDSSYTIYLSHLMFLIVINTSGITDWIAAKGGSAFEIFSILLLGLFWLFSVYYYKMIERKLYLSMASRPFPSYSHLVKGLTHLKKNHR